MCLPDFVRFEQVEESSPLIGYRSWKNLIENTNLELHSEVREYIWSSSEGPHEVKDINSGIYAYNYNYNYNNNYYNNNYYYNNYNNNNYYYYNNYYYNIMGIIIQYGKIAIHKTGQRSEYARIKSLYTIRESDAKGPGRFLKWIIEFNIKIKHIAEKYNCDTINWQDFMENQK